MPILYHHIDSSNSSDYSVTAEPQLPEGVQFIYGRAMTSAVPEPLVFEVDFPSRDALPHFIGDTLPLFSTRLVDTFRSAGVENFQVFPAVLRNPALGADWDGYWVFNVIGLVAAADLDRSNADTLMAGGPKGAPALLAFHELVLDHQKTRNVAMFRLAESPDMLLIHDRVLTHIRNHRPENGWGFEATEIETI